MNFEEKDLHILVKISQTSIAKLAHNENITTDTLVYICEVLRYDIGNIQEFTIIMS